MAISGTGGRWFLESITLIIIYRLDQRAVSHTSEEEMHFGPKIHLQREQCREKDLGVLAVSKFNDRTELLDSQRS